MLGVIFAHQTAADRFDRAVDAPVITWFGHHPGLAVDGSAFPGSLVPMAVLSVAIAAACLLAGRLNGAVLVVAAVPVAAGLNDGLLKHLFDRTYLAAPSYRAAYGDPCSRWPRPRGRCCCSPRRRSRLGPPRCTCC